MSSVPEYNLRELGPWERDGETLWSAPDPVSQGRTGLWWNSRNGRCTMIAVAGRSTLLERIRVTLAVRRLMMRKLWGTRSISGRRPFNATIRAATTCGSKRASGTSDSRGGHGTARQKPCAAAARP